MGNQIISKEFKYPTPNAKKKKWWYTFRCEKCNEISSKWYHKKLFKPVCQACLKGRLTTEEFISRSKKHHGDFYDYSKTIYKSKRDQVTIICPKHGEFSQRAQEHMIGRGCVKCSADSRSLTNRYTLNVWKDRLKEKFPDLQLLETEDKTEDDYVRFSCKTHGEFTSQLKGIRDYLEICPTCRKKHHQKQSIRENLLGTKANLYYVYIPSLDMYKLGVTTNIVKRATTLKEDYELIWTEQLDYSFAIDLEHEIHTQLKDLRYMGIENLLKEGSRELYTQDILEHIHRIRGLHRSDPMSKAT